MSKKTVFLTMLVRKYFFWILAVWTASEFDSQRYTYVGVHFRMFMLHNTSFEFTPILLKL